MGVYISSLGYYLPKRIVDNDELVTLITGNADNGINTDEFRQQLIAHKANLRHFRSTDESGLSMAEQAARCCLERACCSPDQVELILFGGMSRDFLEPSMGVILQYTLGAHNAFAFDLSNSNHSFMNLLEVGYRYLAAGKYKNALIIGAENCSDWIPWEKFSESTSSFYGMTMADGAAAMFLQNDIQRDDHFHLFQLKTFTEYHDLCTVQIGKRQNDLKLIFKDEKLNKAMDQIFAGFVPGFLTEAEKRLGAIDHIFLHQLTGEPRNLYKMDEAMFSKVYTSFPRVGNTGGISIPLGMALAEEEGLLRRGDRLAAVVGDFSPACGGVAFTY